MAVGAAAVGAVALDAPDAQTALPAPRVIPGAIAPDISDDGRVVSFQQGDQIGLWIDGAVQPPLGPGSRPAVSGDGCVVAHVAGPDVVVTAARSTAGCTVPPERTVATAAPTGSPAVSANGNVVVWSTGTTVVRAEYDANAWTTSSPALAPNQQVGAVVDVSPIGDVVVFSIETLDQGQVVGTDVYGWSGADGASPVLFGAGGSAPSISGTRAGSGGLQVLFAAPAGVRVLADAAAVLGGATPASSPVAGGEGASRPAVSTDGRHAAFDRSASVVAVSQTGTADFFAATSSSTISSSASSTSGPVISRNGRWVAYDDGGRVLVVDRAQVATSPVDFGNVTVGDTVTRTVTFTADAQSIPVPGVGVVVSAPFTLESTTCAGVLEPGVSCTVQVTLAPKTAGAKSGSATLRGFDGGVSVSSALTAAATSPSTSPPTSPATTSPSTSAPPTTQPAPVDTAPVATDDPSQTTLPLGTAPATLPDIGPPPAGDGSSGGGSSGGGSSGGSSSGGGSSGGGSSGRPTSTATTTTTLVGPVLTFSPPSFEFAPTIVVHGRRTAVVELVNASSTTSSITEVRLDGAGSEAFTIASTTCTAVSLAPGTRCEVQLEFAPSVVGQVTVSLIADTATGSPVSASIIGTGAPAPTLTVDPDVAAGGQVVAVRGSGFPAGAVVAMSIGSDLLQREVTVDDQGTFAETVLLMSRMASGPHDVRIAGQVDLFGDVVGEVLVTRTGSTTSGVLDGVGVDVGP